MSNILTHAAKRHSYALHHSKYIFGLFGRITLCLAAVVSIIAFAAVAASAQAINFESPTYTIGNINGQDGWIKTGPYDVAVSASNGTAGFGAQSFRISNAVTSGSFGDWAFSKPVANEAGEAGAANGGMSGGVRKNRFEAQYTIASTVPGSQQPGLQMQADPDRGDGARMSYLRYEDQADGIHVFFDDYQDVAPFGTSLGDPNGCGGPGAGADDFIESDIATLNRSVPHTIRISMQFVNGPRNDIVQIYIDGTLVKTGTSWEDYFRYCEGNPTRTVDSLIFLARTGGGTAPATNGLGFLIDNLTINSPSTLIVDDDSACPGASFTTIQAAVNAANSGDIVQVCPGTYNESLAINKSLTLDSTGGRDVTTIQLSAASSIFLSGTGSNITINGFTVRGVDGTPTVIGNVNIAVTNAPGAIVVISNNRILVGKQDYSPDGDDSIGILTYTGAVPINTSLTVTNNIFGSVSAGAVVNRAFYVNPSTSSFTFQNNQISGDFRSSAVSEADTTLIDNNVVTGTGTSYGFSVNDGGTGSYVGSTITRNLVSNTMRAVAVGTYTFATNASVRGNTFLNNALGVRIISGSSVSAFSFNRIVGNTVAVMNNAVGPLNAVNNWWGCNYGPGATGAGCSGTTNGVAGTAATSSNPWLTLRTSATPNAILVTATSAISSNLNFNSSNTDTSGLGSVPNTTPATFTGTLGTVSPTSSTTTSGVTGTTFTAGGAAGSGNAATTIDGQTVAAPIAISYVSTPCNNVSIPTGITTLSNQQVSVPINIDDVTNRGILGYITTVTYDQTKLAYIGFDQVGTLSSGFTVTINSGTPGVLKINTFGTTPPSGAGVLLGLRFFVNGAINAVPTPVNFTSFSLNEGVPCSVTQNGSVTIISSTITGTVTYANAPSITPVPLTTLSAAGSVNVSTSSAANGTYTLSGLGAGAYTVTPSKNAQPIATVNGITPFDAALIAQHLAGFTTLNSTQLLAADVTGNGTVSPLDAAYIAQWSAGIPNPGITGTWKFLPVTRSYPLGVVTPQPNQDYSAILMGDVTGNWSPTLLGGNFAQPADGDISDTKDAITASAPTMESSAGSPVIVPIEITDLTGKGVIAYQFDLTYDPTVMEPQTVAADISGTISGGMNVVSNSPEPGVLKVSVYGTAPVNGRGVLVNLRFSAIGGVGSSTQLRLRGLLLNEGGLRVNLSNGRLTIVATQHGTIHGKLLTTRGMGVSRARVVITSTTGDKREVISTAFGDYEFGGLQIGESYTITVNHKRYSFSPQTVVIADGLTNMDIIAEQ